ncbi:MAG: hypothetical protein LBG66_01445 [Gallionellaceae bacterium]|jgi:heme/copper-type cytochrome/quinol oxidase subunit 2|nr:hypothetical protein [Gallionellaceae bacterium]
MYRILARLGWIPVLLLIWAKPGYALDSYRFLHVTVDTPWTIFLFLLIAVFSPFVLMAILVWRYSERKTDQDETEDHPSGDQQK